MIIEKRAMSCICLIVILMVSVFNGIFAQSLNCADFFNPMIQHCDAWLFMPAVLKNADYNLFPQDMLIDYALFQIPKGYLAFMSILNSWFSIFYVLKVMPIVICSVSAVFLFVFCRKLCRIEHALLSVMLFIVYSWTFQTVMGLTPRAFFYLFFIPFIYFLYYRKEIPGLISFLLMQLFYPPAALICFLTYLLYRGKDIAACSLKNPACLSLLCMIISMPVIFYLQFPPGSSENFGSVVSLTDMLNMPEFFPGGKEAFFFNNSSEFLRSASGGIGLRAPLVYLAVIYAVLLIFAKNYKPMRLSKAVILSSIVWYIFAHIVPLRLYLPSRYIMFSFPLMLILESGRAVCACCKPGKSNNYLVIPFVLFIVIFSCSVHRPYEMSGGMEDYRHLSGLYEFLSGTPEDSLIAAEAYISDPVCLLSQRSILFSDRFLIPFRKRYYLNISQRALDFYEAYYSGSIEKIKTFSDKYGVDYMVFDKCKLSNPEYRRKYSYHEPFVRIEGGSHLDAGSVFEEIDPKNIVFQQDNIAVIEAENL